ncbi:hypothetical protein ACFQ9V_05455 [Leifsonia sp. NPDC056665]|uniref:hypothetical protein n=1 Tax=Leifsonia sp. NPDC056665 TaxID=3345901 RepID=UPI0036923782
MSPADSSALAAWAAAGVAALFGITGFVVGLVGLRHARQAKEAAAAANLIAKDANSISKQANTLSEESNGIAREANEISGRVAARSDEQHDVDWDWRFDSDHEDMVKIQNIGKNTAHETVVQFMFREVTEANKLPMVVVGRETIRFQIPTLAEAIQKERADRESHASNPARLVIPWTPRRYRFRLRVTWRTELGTPKQYDSDWTLRYLPD